MDIAPSSFVSRYQNRAEARRQFGDMADRYASFYRKSDELADAVVAHLEGSPGARGLVTKAAAGGLRSIGDAPPALREFFAQLESVPEWVDFAQINLGARSFQRLGMAGIVVLGAWSLLNGYHSAPAVKPLAFTGALKNSAPMRLAQTARFVSEVVQEKSLHCGASGYRMAIDVRLVHAFVRSACHKNPRWRTDDWGLAINQADMLGTIFEFSWLVVEGARQMGFRFSREESDAMFLLWRYCGYLSGVDEELLEHISSEDKAREVGLLMQAIQPGPDEDSLALAEAFFRVPVEAASNRRERFLGHLASNYQLGLARVFNGDEVADGLGLRDTRWKYAIYPTRAWVSALEFFRPKVFGATRLAALVGNRSVRRDIGRQLRLSSHSRPQAKHS